MTDDRISGPAKNIGGQVEEGFGRVTGDVKMQVHGKARQAEGALQDLYGQAKETATDAAGAIRESAGEAGDFLRTTIEERPYTTAAIALGIGFLIGRLGRSAVTRVGYRIWTAPRRPAGGHTRCIRRLLAQALASRIFLSRVTRIFHLSACCRVRDVGGYGTYYPGNADTLGRCKERPLLFLRGRRRTHKRTRNYSLPMNGTAS